MYVNIIFFMISGGHFQILMSDTLVSSKDPTTILNSSEQRILPSGFIRRLKITKNQQYFYCPPVIEQNQGCQCVLNRNP